MVQGKRPEVHERAVLLVAEAAAVVEHARALRALNRAHRGALAARRWSTA